MIDSKEVIPMGRGDFFDSESYCALYRQTRASAYGFIKMLNPQ